MRMTTIKIKHHYQPTGNTCGPTCLYMVHEYLQNYPNDLPFTVPTKITIQDIEYLCGTDWEVGTPPDRMEIGMKELRMRYVEYANLSRPYDLLKLAIDSGNIPILRTITRGVPHWIIVPSYLVDANDGFVIYNVLDPWQGEIQYNQKQLSEVWKQRQYQFFEVIVPEIKGPIVNPETGEINLRYRPLHNDEDYYLTIRNEDTTGDTTE